MEINGLPLHALAVHAAVVFAPLSALTGLGYAVVPRWRDRVRWPLVAVAAVAAVSVWVAYLSGLSLLEHNDFFRSGPVHELVQRHRTRAGVLRFVMTGYAVVSILAAALHRRTGAGRVLLLGLVAVGAVATAVYTVLTGDAGAQIAWQGIRG
jgi:hypothetical protein